MSESELEKWARRRDPDYPNKETTISMTIDRYREILRARSVAGFRYAIEVAEAIKLEQKLDCAALVLIRELKKTAGVE